MPESRGERPVGRPNRAGQNLGDDRGFWASLLMFIRLFGDFIIFLLPRREVPQQVPVIPRVIVFRRRRQVFLDRLANNVRIALLTIFLSQQDARGRTITIFVLGLLLLLSRAGVIRPFPWVVLNWDPPLYLWPAAEPDDRNEEPGEGENPEHEE
ncbi:uncharacterized protein LOC120275271 [Dioscorea cayenensis subsp. rotundata]|uniref:Uncharacterized protein LOC120275271 n=1 Tax=Dioscorea cayennensis subsp. rotundata TaxID=55577 RepID=A0AB40CCV6_DIOCR|nr:uncharacterized protein LOC120275271 [Dioscorea cayenensis subsp. rotundata]XP_039137734.1 uncharacterized protein LOC120275271 [Dioscorea cayenensis subsp. rotundata]XP_039137735.1 uncharacterized protein LOC120275271 [Dioscorea cayenensis subsp. rotundata]XP_039137736.1 uncharacterized protein LOC120275271 [Dioscorea cayenensis subsp. rotundata]XP_039137737.1 uncharacterized protein LOC120275271 [Dioscorea cayenensis subsp. rotundata]